MEKGDAGTDFQSSQQTFRQENNEGKPEEEQQMVQQTYAGENENTDVESTEAGDNNGYVRREQETLPASADSKKKTVSKTERKDTVSSQKGTTGSSSGVLRCEFCGKTFNQERNLIQHRRVHTGERPFQCSYCNMSFAQQRNLVTHERTHTGDRPFKCSKCDRGFARKDNLRKHMKFCTKNTQE